LKAKKRDNEDKDKELHLVKRVSKELKMTYRELGEAIGYSEGTLRRSVSRNELSPQLKRALELYRENVYLKTSSERIEKAKETLQSLLEAMFQERKNLETFLEESIKKL
jgi:DNA-binding Lrp family transcriptional regulator